MTDTRIISGSVPASAIRMQSLGPAHVSEALKLALDIIYDDLTSCIECGMVRDDDGTPKSGSMDADTRRWFAQVIAAAHAVEAVTGRHLDAAYPKWLADIIDGRIVP